MTNAITLTAALMTDYICRIVDVLQSEEQSYVFSVSDVIHDLLRLLDYIPSILELNKCLSHV